MRRFQAKQLPNGSKAAFSYIKLIIALSLTSVLGLGFIQYLKSSGETRQLEASLNRLENQADEIEKHLKADFLEAIRINGLTQNTVSSSFVRIPDTPRDSNESFDGVRILQGLFNQFTIPLEGPEVLGDRALFTIRTDTLGPKIENALGNIMQSGRVGLVSIQNIRFRNVFRPSNIITEPGSSLISFEVDLSQDPQSLSDQIRVGNSWMKFAKVVEWSVDSEKKLVRKEYLDPSSSPIKEQSFPYGADKLLVSYRFKDYENLGLSIDQDKFLSHINEDTLIDGPRWSDVFDIQIDFSITTNVPTSIAERVKQGQWQLPHTEVLAGPKLRLSRLFSFGLTSFRPDGFQSLTASSDGCNLGDRDDVCKATCDHLYSSSDPNSNNWIGYRTGSPYCQCLTPADGSIALDAEANPPRWDWNTEQGRQRLRACAAAFGCGYSRRADHPGLQLACHYNCIQPDLNPDDGSVDRMPFKRNSDGFYELEYLIPLPTDHPDYQAGKQPMIDSVDDPNVSCRYANRNYCINLAQKFYHLTTDIPEDPQDAAFPSTAWGGSTNPWAKCPCRTHRIDSLGQLMGDDQNAIPVDTKWLALDKICNLDADTEVSCPNTYQTTLLGNDTYKAFDFDTNPQGLSVEQMQLCQCAKALKNQGTEVSKFNHGTDFRKNPQGSTNPIGQSYASVSAAAVTNQQGVVIAPAVNNCAQKYLQVSGDSGSSRAYCLKDFPGSGFRLYSQEEFGDRVNDWIAQQSDPLPGEPTAQEWEYSQFCSAGCLHGYNDFYHNVKKKITHSSDQLPSFCGGPQPSDPADSDLDLEES